VGIRRVCILRPVFKSGTASESITTRFRGVRGQAASESCTPEFIFTFSFATPRSLREVEAEAVALLCCESLGLEGAEVCRGYIQIGSVVEPILMRTRYRKKSAQKVFRASDQIIRAGRSDIDPVTA